MAHKIEIAKSGRATCRTCREKIDKDQLRFGEEAPNTFDPGGPPSYFWHHLMCAAKKRPADLKAALEAYTGEVANRAELDAIIAGSKAGGGASGPKTFPYAEHAPTGRSKCMACEELIEKGLFRVAIEREVDTGSFATKSAGYLHLRCAAGQIGDAELSSKLKTNSGLNDAEFAEVAAGL